MALMDNIDGLFSSPQIPQGGVMGEPRANPTGDARLAFASQLLAGSNSYGGAFAPILGNALAAGQQARSAAQQAQAKQQLEQAQIGHLNAQSASLRSGDSLFGNITPDKFTPESLAKFQQTRNYGDLVMRAGEGFGNVNPGEFSPESLARYATTHNYNDLVRIFASPTPTVQTIAGVHTLVAPNTAPQGGVVRPSGTATMTPLSTLPAEASGAATVAGAEATSKAAGSVTGGAAAQAAIDLPTVQATADRTIATLKQLREHPGLQYITGASSKLPVAPGTNQAGADALAKQVEGQAFLQAFQTLKGGGSITEVEGAKATQAIGRLSRSQRTEDYQKALGELLDLAVSAKERAARTAAKAPANGAPVNGARPPLSSFGGG